MTAARICTIYATTPVHNRPVVVHYEDSHYTTITQYTEMTTLERRGPGYMHIRCTEARSSES